MYLEDIAAEQLAFHPLLGARSQSRKGLQGQVCRAQLQRAHKVHTSHTKKCCLGKKEMMREALRKGDAAVSSITTDGKG